MLPSPKDGEATSGLCPYAKDTTAKADAFSLPTKADNVPAGPNWIHEIKYDGYCMLVVREQDRVRLISRGAGRCRHWIKIKNPAHPAYSRVRDQWVRLGNFAG
jgi:hypothetical protein